MAKAAEMDTQKIQSMLEFKAFMQDLLGKPADEIIKMPDDTFQKFLGFCKELISNFDFPFSFYCSFRSLQDEQDFWVDLVELEADMKCRIYPGTKFDLPNCGRLKHTEEHDGKTFLVYLLSACGKPGIGIPGKHGITFAGDTKGGFPSENTVQWTPLMKLIRNLGIG